MGLILDSSVLISAERQGKNARQMLTSIADKISETEVGISVVTLIELAHGAARADTPERRANRQNFIAELLTAMPIHPVTVSLALRTGQLDGLAEVGIFDCGADNQVHRPARKRLQGLHQTEVGVRVGARRKRIKLHEKVEVALAGPILAGCGRAEQLQTPHMVAATEHLKFRPALGEKGDHGEFSFFKG